LISGACPGFNGRTCSATGINGAYTPAVLLPWLLLMFPLILDKKLEGTEIATRFEQL